MRTNYIKEMPTKSLKPKRIGQLRCKKPTIAIENLIQSPLRSTARLNLLVLGSVSLSN